MQGKIVKGIAGFYYVETSNGIYECKAKGAFRNQKVKPLVGDNVIIEIIDEQHFLGNIVEMLPRKNMLIRPACANIDQAVIVFAVTHPKPNYQLLSRFLLEMAMLDIETVICFNKTDLAQEKEVEELLDNFRGSKCKMIFTSTYDKNGVDELRSVLKGKTTAFAGPSGVGKSSITNLLANEQIMETGEISAKIERGRHTTRHAQLFKIEADTFIMDTPGFTSLYNTMEAQDVRFYFHEFDDYEGKCRFNGCVHVNEPGCSVKEAVSSGIISKLRYDSYVDIYAELKEKRKY
ncbi:MAG: ribosome small subunit-dependent GTPase A [Lachnospiraceae bacterium]